MTEGRGGTATGPAVTLTVSQETELTVGAAAEGVHAFFDIHTRGLGSAVRGAAPETAEVIVVDCSGSMGSPRSKITAARDAAVSAVAGLREGTRFAVVEGRHVARMVYPPDERLERADHDTRAEAAAGIRRLYPNGGTSIGAWLGLARRLFANDPGDIRHAVLLTDGWNAHHPELLAHELDACEGLFVCDARGIGDGWNARELKLIADRLHGTADAVLRDTDLTAEFESMIRASMARTVAGLPIRLSLMPGSTLRFLKQVYPTERELTGSGRWTDDRTVEFPTDAWGGDETRQYHLCLEAGPEGRPQHEELQLGYVDVAVPLEGVPAPDPVPVLVRWIPGDRASTVVSRIREHFDLHHALGRTLAEAYEAYQDGDTVTTEARLVAALPIAHRLDDQEKLRLLAEVLDITDPVTGQARLKEAFDPRHMGRFIMLGDDSTVFREDGAGLGGSAPRAPGSRPPLGASGATRICPNPDCEARSPADARFCVRCAHALADAGAAADAADAGAAAEAKVTPDAPDALDGPDALESADASESAGAAGTADAPDAADVAYPADGPGSRTAGGPERRP
ncbi:VWA domain-containing protein [Streptomyces sp. NPDC002018]|uniref:VWA domain-containing protein n=1 Tax=Streptomyces sp. NPDC002018 TaxID=3364629 RepID=UPI0036BC4588